jgi:hypothetical protein
MCIQELAGQPVGVAAAETTKKDKDVVAASGVAKLVKDVSIALTAIDQKHNFHVCCSL